MTKKELYAFTAAVYRRLRDREFIFKLRRMKGSAGMWHYNKRIELNPDNDMLSTLVHEVLHDMHPFVKEEFILKREAEIFHQLSYRQLINMGKRLFDTLGRDLNKKKGQWDG